MYSFILLIALFTVLGSGYDIRKLSVEAPEQSYDGSIDQGQNTDTGGLVWDSGLPYYGKPTDCTWSGGRRVGNCDCPNQQSKFAISTPDGEIGYAICAKECTKVSDCPPAPGTERVDVECILGRCLLDCSGMFEILPPGIWHRFCVSEESPCLQAVRLFTNEPQWTAYPRQGSLDKDVIEAARDDYNNTRIVKIAA